MQRSGTPIKSLRMETWRHEQRLGCGRGLVRELVFACGRSKDTNPRRVIVIRRSPAADNLARNGYAVGDFRGDRIHRRRTP